MSDDLKSRTFRGVFWSFFERFSVQGVQFVLGIVLARLLLPSDYGIIAMLAIFMSISQVFIDGGFSSALIQCSDRTARDYSTVFYMNLGISLLCYAALYLGAPAIAAFYDQPLLVPVTRVYALNLVLNSLVAVHRVQLTIDLNFKVQSKISLGAAVLSGLAGIAAAWAGWGVWALVVQMLCSAAVNVLLSYYYVRWLPGWTFSGASFRKLFLFGSKLLAASLINSVYTNLYTLVIGKKFPPASLGVYTRADQFAQFTSTNIAGILSRVFFPVLSRFQDDDERLKRVYSKYIQLSAFLVFPLILGLCGVARPLILLLLTEKWSGSILLLQILCAGCLWTCITTINLNLLYVKGRSDLVLRLEVIKKSVALLILLATIPFGLIAICAGLSVYSFLAFYMNTYYTRKLLDYGFLRQLRELFPYLFLSLVVLAEALLLSRFVESHLLSLILSLLLCSATYIVLGYLLRVSALDELFQLVFKRSCYR